MIDILLDLSMNAKINNTDQILVKYFLNQREKLIELSLEDVIYDTGLSKSSIIRFCKSIKTSHFTDFKKTFVREFNAVICDFIYLLDDRDKLDDLVIASAYKIPEQLHPLYQRGTWTSDIPTHEAFAFCSIHRSGIEP